MHAVVFGLLKDARQLLQALFFQKTRIPIYFGSAYFFVFLIFLLFLVSFVLGYGFLIVDFLRQEEFMFTLIGLLFVSLFSRLLQIITN